MPSGRPLLAAATWLLLALCAAGGACQKEEPPGGRSPVDREARIRACTILRGCGHSVLDSLAVNIICGSPTLSEAYSLRSYVESIIACVNAAPGKTNVCVGVAECLNLQGTTTCAAGFVDTCDGDRVIQCSGGYVTAFDCSASGYVCGMGVGTTTCRLADCSMVTPECDGDILRTPSLCMYQDCSVAGLTCRHPDMSVPFCAGEGDPCDGSTFKAYCDGDVARFCGMGFEATLDCSAFLEGHTCLEVLPAAVVCVPSAEYCTDVMDDECYYDLIRVCLDGEYWVFDCTELGFRTCQEIDNLEYCVK